MESWADIRMMPPGNPSRDDALSTTMGPGKVEVSQSGRGGSIHYREGSNTATFDWEFASPPALALIFGPTARTWDRRYPWAEGRQAEIFAFVAAEVVREKAAGAGIEIDLGSGTISLHTPS